MELTAEPAVTRHLRALLEHVRARFTSAQRATMERDHFDAPMDGGVLRALRTGAVDLGALRRYAAKLSDAPIDTRAEGLGALIAAASERPTAASALAWTWLGAAHSALASHVIHVIRERAGLPRLRARISADAPSAPLGAWFADRQLEDAAAWIEHVPAPDGDTFAAVAAATEAQRAGALRVDDAELVPFLQRAAAFFAALSRGGVDPLGFPLARDAELLRDPPLAQRLELAAWARTAGRRVAPRGRLRVLRIAIDAPWPLALELIAAELGCGVCGGAGLLLRLAGGVAAPRSSSPSPVLLCLPGEPVEELGPRFERWLARAYPHAVEAWRPWC